MELIVNRAWFAPGQPTSTPGSNRKKTSVSLDQKLGALNFSLYVGVQFKWSDTLNFGLDLRKKQCNKYVHLFNFKCIIYATKKK